MAKFKVNLEARSGSDGEVSHAMTIGYFAEYRLARAAGISLLGLNTDDAVHIFNGRYVLHAEYAEHDSGRITDFEVERVGGETVREDHYWYAPEMRNPVKVQVAATDTETGIEMIRTLAVLDGDYEGAALHTWREDTGTTTLVTADRVTALRDLLEPAHTDDDVQSALYRTLSRAARAMRRPNSVMWPGGVIASADTVRIILG